MKNKDNQIISKYIENNSIKKNCQYWNHIDTEDQIYIKDKFKHIKDIKLSECLYMILHHLNNRPICPICHNEIKLERFSLGYKTFCSNNCKYSDKGKQITLEKQKNTCLEKYGVDNPMKDISIKNKSISKCKETNKQKYDVEYNFQRENIRKQIIQTVKNKTGYEYAFLNKEKVLDTLHNKYGSNIDNVFQLDYVKNKSNKTKELNNSFNTSKYEDITYEILSNHYSNVLRQYKSELYPFNCDFYISDKDVYIEINASWTHGKHPFVEDNLNDVKLYNEWMTKSNYYKNSAYNWRFRDTKKRNIAKENNLKYFEIFPINIEDLKNKLKKIIQKIDNL